MDTDTRQQLRIRVMEQLRHSILSDSHVTFLHGDESDQQVLGSGTLVSIGAATAILTADHVLARLQNPIRVLFPSRFDDSPGSTPGPPKTLQYSETRTVARGTDEVHGPDLGLLIVLKCDVPSAKAFYSLTKHASHVLTAPRANDDGGWALVGAPAEWTALVDEPDAAFASVKEQRVLIGATDVQKEFEKDGFDYLDIAIDYDGPEYGGPTCFGACSGGGLWHIELGKTIRGEIDIGTPILSGVAFYQFPRRDGMIRCHGRRSIYQRVPQAIQS